MPPYRTGGTNSTALNITPSSVLYPGENKHVFGVPGAVGTSEDSYTPETINTVLGSVSIACSIAPRAGEGGPAGLMVQAIATSNPGAAEIDIQESAIDCDAYYLTNTSNANYKLSNWVNNGSIWTAWTEIQPAAGKFVRAKVAANPNTVGFIVKFAYV